MEAAAESVDLAEFHRNDLAFHELIWAAADNEFLTEALERVAFGLFAMVLLQRLASAKSEFLAAVQQHREMADGLATGDAALARKAFVKSTLKYWNENHELGAAFTG